ncbi:MAG: PEGA domain-containing protein [Prolixibacteraceae bacterium]
MKKILTICLLIFFVAPLFAQQPLSVKRFDKMPNDLDARVNEPKKDPDGNLCAIIKVLTTQKGFSFDNGQIGIVGVVEKPGEIWVYVPRETKRLTITHQFLGSLRNYTLPVSIEKATVYEMELITGSVETIIKPLDPVFLTFRSTPEGADVYVNDILKGSTPCSVKLLPGKYTYRVDKALYNPSAGSIIISGQEKDGKTEKTVVLKPAFGTIKINTLPVGATIFLDNEETGKITPFTMTKVKSGSHRITVKKDLYQPQNIEAIVTDGGLFEKTIKLTTNASNVTVNAQNDAEIYIDGKLVGKAVYQGLIPSGVVTFEAKKNGFYTDKKNQDIAVGDSVTINLNPQPIIGRLEILSTPIDAVIYLNGEKKGTTPLPIPNLMVGKYELRLEKEGYFGKLIDVTIVENKTTEINETLVSNLVNDTPPVTAESKNESVKPEPVRTIDKTTEKSVKLPVTKPMEQRADKPIDTSIDKLSFNADYYKYKKRKNFWLTSTLISAGAGTALYFQVKKKYADYQNATFDAERLHEKAATLNELETVAFGIAGFCALEFVIKAGKQGKAKNNSLSFYPLHYNQGAGLGLICKF